MRAFNTPSRLPGIPGGLRPVAGGLSEATPSVQRNKWSYPGGVSAKQAPTTKTHTASKLAASILAALLTVLLTTPAYGARIGDIVETSVWEQAVRFFSFSDISLRFALIGSMLLGISCGLLGSFLVVRKMALVGDALSHAVLPGVALGFLWQMNKDPIAIFVGATAAGLLGTTVVGWITRTTKLKEDAALGLVLASFFAVGVCLISMIQRLPTGNKSGIEKFLFGQAAALGAADITLMAIVTALTCILVYIFYKELLTVSFDPVFASAIGLPVRLVQETLMLLLAFSVVIALQAVGVVLVSAMLITPAAAAYLLTDRLHRMLGLAAFFGLISGVLGAFLSFLGHGLPTGPLMVLAASTVFAGAFFFGPRHGVLPRWWEHRCRELRMARENTLKAMYQVLEAREFAGESVSLEELATRRRETLDAARHQAVQLARHSLATFDATTAALHLTPEGWRAASSIVRNHRLWELYLTSAAAIPADHVHDEAEKMEHVLREQNVRELERKLKFPILDPHGKTIPDVREATGRGPGPRDPSGYGSKH